MNSKGAMIALAIIAFLMAAVLVLVIVKMLFGGRLRMPGGRARQARLGIVDAFDLDRQRQLIIVRRDNTEHLIMIGGPNDLVIESEIVRVEARDLRRDKAGEFAGLANDGRIPAPFAAPGERSDQPELVQPPLEPTQSFAVPVEAMLPPPLPPASQSNAGIASMPSIEADLQRTPTFPLPPRRPPPPERRPMPPPRPDPSRMEPARAEGGTEAFDMTTRPLVQVPAQPSIDAPVALNPPPPGPMSSGTGPSGTGSSGTGSSGTGSSGTGPSGTGSLGSTPPTPLVAPAPATPRTMPPSFLKPLPPRPPLRPLVRTNPRPPGAQEPTPLSPPAPAPSMPSPVEPPPIEAKTPEVVAPSLEAPVTLPPVIPPAPPIASAPEKDALESLEEEMAKLLGRGPS